MYECSVCGAIAAVRPGMCPACFNTGSYLPQTTVQVYRAAAQVQTFRELYGRSERSAAIPEWWRRFLGAVPEVDGWLAMFFGAPGSWKSTALLLLLAEVAREGVFVSIEEGLGESLRTKIRRLELFSENVVVTTDASVGGVVALARERGTRWIAWDSLTVSALLPEDLEQLKRDGFRVVFATHATKEGEYVGPSGLAHVTDLVARFESGTATVVKNRFGEAGVTLDFRNRLSAAEDSGAQATP